MFQLIMGCLLLVFTAGLLMKYQPKTFSSWYVCLLCGLMAMVSIIAGGGSWILQMTQTSAQILIAACSLFHLHREKVFAARKAKVVMSQSQGAKCANVKQKRVQTQNKKVKPNMMPKEVLPVQRCA